MRDRRRYLHWVFEAKKRFGLCVLDYIVTSNHVRCRQGHKLAHENRTNGRIRIRLTGTKIRRGEFFAIVRTRIFEGLSFDVRQRLVGNQPSVASLSYPLSDDVAQDLFRVGERNDLGWI
jgi:hypothetical protein